MDLLKDLIKEKKKDVIELKKQCGKEWIPRREIERRETEQILIAHAEDESRRKEQELKRFELIDHFLNEKKRNYRNKNGLSNDDESIDNDLKLRRLDALSKPDHPTEEDDILGDSLPVPREEVMRRLRRRGQVVTYFGESDKLRYKRLYQLELSEHDDELMGGQQNVFLQLLDDGSDNRSHRTQRPLPASALVDYDSDEEEEEKDKIKFAQSRRSNRNTTLSNLSHSEDSSNPIRSGKITETLISSNIEDKETCIRSWIRKMVRLWEEELDARPDSEKKTGPGKVATAQCRQTWKDLLPLLKKLKQRQVDTNILDKIHCMVILCEEKNYKAAHDKYIELSIGNAAWPMGVTMVGIHERAGRSKIFTSEIAHILNDETTRKYIHMFKRLISLAQRRFPADPSRMVSLSTTHV